MNHLPAHSRIPFAKATSFLTAGFLFLIGTSFFINLTQAEELPLPTKSSWASFRNGNLQQGVSYTKLPEKLEQLWKVDVPDGVMTTCAIVADHVYVPTLNGHLLCLDRKTGTEIWRYRSIEDPDPETFAPGFSAAPRCAGQLVFAGDEDGFLHAIERSSGKQAWKFATQDQISGCVAILEDKVLLASYDFSLYCLKAETGELLWSLETADRINCSPSVVEGYTFVAGCDHLLRKVDINKGEQKSEIPLGTFLIASPAIRDEMLYVGTQEGEMVAINWKTDEIAWRYQHPKKKMPIHSSAAVTEDRVYFGGQDKMLHAIDRKTGKGAWTFRTRAGIDSSPVVVDNRIFFGSRDRNLYGVSSEGKQVFKKNLGKSIVAGPAIGEGCLVIGTEGSTGAVYCFGGKEQ